MKKFLILFLILCVTAGFAAAEDEDGGIGLSVGLEFGIENVGKANGENMNPYIMPMLIYDNSFLNGDLDIYAEVDYKFGFTKVYNDNWKKVFPQSLYIDFSIGYNLKLGEASTLSFILENEFDELIISPRSSFISNLTGIFTPAVKFNQELSIGDLYAQISVPTTYYDKYSDKELGLNLTVGWSSTFGLGIEAKICTMIIPISDAGYAGFELTISYETDPIYVEVETIIPSDISGEGVTITPEFDFSFKSFTFYVKSEFTGIGVSGGKVIISPALGIKYSF